MRTARFMVAMLLLIAPLAIAQDRATKVRNDRKQFEGSADWIYNNLDAGIRAAKDSGKPLLVVFRCIPCEACQEFDDDVARRDPIIRDLMDDFVCVRLVQANTIDLARFQFDFDMSFFAFLMNSDMTIYGRFGTRSGRAEDEDISLEGLRKAMEAALKLHRDYERIKPMLNGKQVTGAQFRTPDDYPALHGRYKAGLDYSGQVVRSCMHCHQIRDAERLFYRSDNKPMPDKVLFPFPDPGVLGLTMDPKQTATVTRVAAGSPAAAAGIAPGDAVTALDGQPLLSIADLQWVLQNAPDSCKLPAEIKRAGKTVHVVLDLKTGWRRGDVSWRTTTWELRRMGTGGMVLEDLPDQARGQAKLDSSAMALRVKYLGQYGDHGRAKRAGLEKGDVIVSFDGQERRMTESQLIAYAVQTKHAGDEVSLTVLRDGKRLSFHYVLQ